MAGETKSIFACLKIQERRAKLLGLDAPAVTAVASQVTVTHEDKLVMAIQTDEELLGLFTAALERRGLLE